MEGQKEIAEVGVAEDGSGSLQISYPVRKIICYTALQWRLVSSGLRNVNRIFVIMALLA
jgi:hypothetical protein